MTRLFLPKPDRESLLKDGRATWRKRVEPQPEDYSPRGWRWWASADEGVQACFVLPSVGQPAKNHGMNRFCPTPPGREYWVPEIWTKFGTDAVIYQASNLGYPVDAWRSAATMPQWAARLHVRVTSVRVVKVGEWFWQIDLERTTP